MITTISRLPRSADGRGAPVGEGCLHLCNGLDPGRDGGMVPSIMGMTGALAARGELVRIVTPNASRLPVRQVPEGVSLSGPEEVLEEAVSRAAVVHMHGLWQGHSRRGARAARSHGVPYLIAAHGMADPWALKQKAWKKRVYRALVEDGNLRRASCLHALAWPEVAHFRALAPGTPVCLVPNGVDLATFSNLPPRGELEREHPELIGKFLLLFMGRLHVKKGLDLLAGALRDAADRWPELHLVLAGKDDGAAAGFRARIAEYGLKDRVTELGHVSGSGALRVWGAADAFVLPSYSEGFSMAVLEALACSLPCLITTACNFPELAETEGALVVESEQQAVTAGLHALGEQSPVERREMAGRGRALVESRYTWERQAERLADVYHWLKGGGAAPAAVLT